MMIREYKDSDKEQIKHLYRDAEYPQPTLSKYDDPHYDPYVYEKDGKIIGVIVLENPYLNTNIYNLYVDKEHRGGGIGTELIKFAGEYARENDMHGIITHTAPENKRAQKFYKKLGFKKVGKVKNFDVKGETDVFFWKEV